MVALCQGLCFRKGADKKISRIMPTAAAHLSVDMYTAVVTSKIVRTAGAQQLMVRSSTCCMSARRLSYNVGKAYDHCSSDCH